MRCWLRLRYFSANLELTGRVLARPVVFDRFCPAPGAAMIASGKYYGSPAFYAITPTGIAAGCDRHVYHPQ
jgi:hypothetical protein